MWVVIIILVIVGIILFKIFDRDFILATKQSNGNYHLKFENGQEPLCTLVDTFKKDDKLYYVFIPISSLRKVPDEDIIILRLLKNNDGKLSFVFATGEDCELIFHTVKKDYAQKYNFEVK